MPFTVEDVLRARRPARPVLWACLNRRCARLRWVGPDSTCPTCGAEGGELLA